MHWTVATQHYYQNWLSDYAPGDRHTFEIHPRSQRKSRGWHFKRKGITTAGEWLETLEYSRSVWKHCKGGVITLFPQLATTIGGLKRLANRRAPIVAWDFNLGRLYPGMKRQLARGALASVDRFIVHSRRESERYSEWLGLPIERFRYVPLARFAIPVTHPEERERPFLLAMGSAQRDYPTFFEAVRSLGIRTIVVAASHALAGLTIPECVELRSGLTLDDCRVLAQQARVSVVPVANDDTASGQVTVVEAMRMGRPVIATDCMGTEDYLESGSTGILVRRGSVPDLTEAIKTLWDDESLRGQLGQNAKQYAAEHFSDEAVGLTLGSILDEVENECLGTLKV